jgi:glutathione S-transferase
MRLFIRTPAPSALKVLIFADECRRHLDTVEVADLMSPDFLAMNPFGTVPVLETNAGEFISESLTICRYLDQFWAAGLFGGEARDEFEIELWERRAELRLFDPAIEYLHQTHPMFAETHKQQPDVATSLASRARSAMEVFDRQLQARRFIAGGRFSAADITGFLGVFTFASFGVVDLFPLIGLRRWFEEVAARPSMGRLQALKV